MAVVRHVEFSKIRNFNLTEVTVIHHFQYGGFAILDSLDACWATHEEHLVFIVLLIVVVSNAVCFNSVEFSYCTRFVWKCLFTPPKMVFWSI